MCLKRLRDSHQIGITPFFTITLLKLKLSKNEHVFKSRALRKDLPIFSKSALTKNEQTLIDNEIEVCVSNIDIIRIFNNYLKNIKKDFVKQMPSVEKNHINIKISRIST